MDKKFASDSTITIRLATASDARRLAELRFLFRAALNPVNETEAEFVARCSDWMAARLQSGSNWRCWIAEAGATGIGTLWLQLIEKIPNPVVEPEFHAYLSNIFVCEDMRGNGLGTRLLQTALDWSQAKQVQAVILWPTAQSRSLYERHGFAVSESVMALEPSTGHDKPWNAT